MTTLSRPRVAAESSPRPPLVRPRECLVTGTAAGLASHLGLRPWPTRIVLLVLGPIGALFYVWLWMFVPWEPATRARSTDAPTGTSIAAKAAPSRRAPVAWILTAIAVVLAISFLPLYRDPAAWTPLWGYGVVSEMSAARAMLLLAATVLAATAAGVWAGVVDRPDPARGVRHALIVRLLVVALLVLLFVMEAWQLTDGGGAVQAARTALPLLGLVAVLVTTLVRRWRELSGESVRRIREEHRAEMAAHLHDSVLQTLALIQNRAGGSSEVARLARAQERELRSWLYDGDTPADSDLPTDLRDYAGGLELDFPVRIDVVSAGSSTERASGEVAAAAREAMLNAARHAGGEISVYIEGSPASVDVFVRDRGPGFDPDEVPADRLGVRESIVGRLRRIGGTASIRPGAGGSGTEVHLHLTQPGGRHA